MEKFGIFELLDALSALSQEAEREPEQTETAQEPPPKPKAEEGQRANADRAIEGFYARHAAVAKRAAKNKPD